MRCEACGCDCAESDAETERLRVWCNEALDQRDKAITEVERLKAKVESARVELRQQWERMQKENLALKNSLAEKDAEIARQGKAIRKLEECNEYLLGRVLENNQLITELADAFERYKLLWDGDAELIQRAREAAKQ